MHDEQMTRRAKSFEQGAADYDRLRPGYPDALFADLAEQAGDRLHGRVLELGAGTGRATLPLVRLGVTVDVVEPSQDMLDVLAAALTTEGHADRARLRRATFEDVDPGDRYDVVVAAQCFHWTDPATRWSRLASLLDPDGRAFLFWNGWHLDPGAHDADAVRRLYAERGEGLSPDLPDSEVDRVPGWAETEIDATPGLRLAATDTYAWPFALTVDDYLGLLSTTSQYAVLDADRRESFLAALGTLLGPTVTLQGETLSLTVAPPTDAESARTPGRSGSGLVSAARTCGPVT